MNNLRFPGGKKKAFTLSFDDGVTDDRRFIGIINRFGLKGTFNLNSYSLTHAGGREKVTVEELGTLYQGHEIAVHTWSHPCPSETFSGNFAYEIMKDRELLEQYTGRIIRGMAYPMGSTYIMEDNAKTVRQCGIAYARTTGDKKIWPSRELDIAGSHVSSYRFGLSGSSGAVFRHGCIIRCSDVLSVGAYI